MFIQRRENESRKQLLFTVRDLNNGRVCWFVNITPLCSSIAAEDRLRAGKANASARISILCRECGAVSISLEIHTYLATAKSR